MPAGCEFTCRNEKCEQYKNGRTITSPWPMGRIELVLNSNRVKENPELREYFINLKNQGEKFACIQLPNDDQIPIIAYRVSLWNNDEFRTQHFHIEESNIDNLEEAILKANLPSKCEKTGCELKNFNTITTEGINCPFCKEKMQQNRWFANDK